MKTLHIYYVVRSAVGPYFSLFVLVSGSLSATCASVYTPLIQKDIERNSSVFRQKCTSVNQALVKLYNANNYTYQLVSRTLQPHNE